MKLHTCYQTLKLHLTDLKNQNKTIGFVPTMGALHLGHLSLMELSASENDVSVVSIFVNPTQFNNFEDLEKYPRNLEKDMELINTLKGDFIIYAPGVDDMYEGKPQSQKYNFEPFDKVMEGAFRVGHFDGVATVVRKFFERINPDKAYFGEKDYQQLLIVKEMVNKFALPVQIVSCPIIREENGLAMSSRNQRLSCASRKDASLIYKTLLMVKEHKNKWSVEDLNQFVEGVFAADSRFDLEYFIIADAQTLQPCQRINPNKIYRAFIAVNIEGVRLIDNLSLD